MIHKKDDWKGKPYCCIIHANCIYPDIPGDGIHCIQCKHFPVKEKIRLFLPFDEIKSKERLYERLYEIGIGKIWMHFENREDKRFIVRVSE